MDLAGAIAHTKAVLANTPTTIFEGAFVFCNILVRVDILKSNNDGTFDLIEVKSSTSVKKEHLPDCAIQLYVLQNLGLQIRQTCLIHLNSNYVRQGELDLSQLFIIRTIDDKLENELNNVPRYLSQIEATLSKNDAPISRIGALCKNPYFCEFKSHCWQAVDAKSIHYITRISDKLRHRLMDNEITLIKDIPDDLDDFKLSALQMVQVESEKNQTIFIDHAPIREHVAQLQYPLYFLDFETYGYAVPQYEGTKPYQHLPFQYSLHVRRSLDAELEHYEFLFDKKENPSRALAEHLIQHIGSVGSIVVYYASFEGCRIKEMANAFVDLATQLQLINERLWDLQIPFAQKWYYHPDFNGSASIKYVLPIFAPKLSYSNLDIQKGDVAQLKYMELINLPENSPDRAKIKNALLEYCGLDTIAMVYILDELLALVK